MVQKRGPSSGSAPTASDISTGATSSSGPSGAELGAQGAAAASKIGAAGSGPPASGSTTKALHQGGGTLSHLYHLVVRAMSDVQPHSVQLTYDDGPDRAGHTAGIVRDLRESGARATFYLVGEHVAEADNYRVVFDMAANGNWLGNHAFDWDNVKDDHVFLHGSVGERAAKILLTERAIQEALARGAAEAKASHTWDQIPAAYRDYIEDVIGRGTGRFRTPGFRSKPWTVDGILTTEAIRLANEALEATGMRWLSTSDMVAIDPEDWQPNKSPAEIEREIKGELDGDSASILLHSRVGATEKATPAIVRDIKKKGLGFSQTPRGTKVQTPDEEADAKGHLAEARHALLADPTSDCAAAGELALEAFGAAHRLGDTEVAKLAHELRSTMHPGMHGSWLAFLRQDDAFRLAYDTLFAPRLRP